MVAESEPSRAAGPGTNDGRLARIIAEQEAIFERRQPGPARLAARARGSLAGGVTSSWQITVPQPVWLSHGRGSKIYDVDGNEYVDLHGGYGAALAGHADLGANRWQIMRRVLVPLLAPAIFASAVLVFSSVIDDFVLVDLLNSGASNTPMSVYIYSNQRGGNGGPALNALGTIMLAMSFLIAVAGYLGYRWLTRGERGSGVAALTTIAGEG